MSLSIRLFLASAPLLPALLLALAEPISAQPSPPQRRDLVGAYYYPWYDSSKWTSHAPQLLPVGGLYKTDSLPMAIQHIDTAAYYGVDVFFMSWWNKSDLTDKHLRAGYLKAPNNHKVKFAMLMEPLGDLDTLDGKRDAVVDFASDNVLKGWIDIFRYFKTEFFGHPSYFKLGGRPVVLIYVTRTFKNFGPRHIDSLKAAVGDVYLMADEAFLFDQQDPETARNGIRNRQTVFESYVSYNSYEAARIVTGDNALSYQRRVAMPYYTAWAQKTLFHPPIMPYYRDFRDGHPPLPGTMADFKTVIDEIRALPLLHPASDSVTRVYLVTSWNEWFEGTSIEPSKEHGIQPCKVLREAFVERGSASRREFVTVVKESPIKLLSVSRGAYACMEPAGTRNVSARVPCEPTNQVFLLVDLGNNEVALKDPRNGKYLSQYTDQAIYPMASTLGTWEIFTRVPVGENVAFRSKKNGAWLRPAADASASVKATGLTLDTDAYFRQEAAVVGLRHEVAAPLDYRLTTSGKNWILTTSRRDALQVTVTDLAGHALLSRRLEGGGTFSLGRIEGRGLKVIRVESLEGAGANRLELVAPRP